MLELKSKQIKTKHGVVQCPSFFPIIGWPAGRGEYDRLFKSLDEFSKKSNHYNFLFNFSSFAFGFSIPKTDFNSHFEYFKRQDLRDSILQSTKISKEASKKLIILLDVGGNRIFNKIILDNLEPSNLKSFDKYFKAYFDFIDSTNVDIFVSFDIGPSYTTRDEISKKGITVWNNLPGEVKSKLNRELLKRSIEQKQKGALIMVPLNASNESGFISSLNFLHNNFGDSIDYLGIGGIANKGVDQTERVLSILNDFISKKSWNVKVHGLGLGGWKNIPLLIKYGVDTCDVATPWRRACTDAISNMYVPLFDDKLEMTEFQKTFSYHKIYDRFWDDKKCNCPFCKEVSIKEIRERYKKADKDKNGHSQHGEDYYDMRIRIFFHNVFQHIALLKKLDEFKNEFGDEFLKEFILTLKDEKMKNFLTKLV